MPQHLLHDSISGTDLWHCIFQTFTYSSLSGFGLFRLVSAYSLTHNTMESIEISRPFSCRTESFMINNIIIIFYENKVFVANTFSFPSISSQKAIRVYPRSITYWISWQKILLVMKFYYQIRSFMIPLFLMPPFYIR